MTQHNNTQQRPNNQDAQANQDQPNHQIKEEETIFDNYINT